MKHRLVFALSALLALLSLAPQHTQAQGFEVGVRDGMSLSWLVGIDDTLPQASFYAGFTGNYFFDQNWGVGVDVTLSEQGALCKKNTQGVTMDYMYHYLNVPLLLQYQHDLGMGHRLRFMAGAQLGIFLAARYDYTAPSITGEGVVSGGEVISREEFHPFDVGVSAGVQWLVGDYTAVELRYTLGVTQTHNGISNTHNGHHYISVPDNRNSVLQIGTVFLF